MAGDDGVVAILEARAKKESAISLAEEAIRMAETLGVPAPPLALAIRGECRVVLGDLELWGHAFLGERIAGHREALAGLDGGRRLRGGVRSRAF